MLDRDKIVELVARAVRTDYDKIQECEQENLQVDIGNVLNVAGFWELVEVAQKYRKGCIVTECVPVKCKECDHETYCIGCKTNGICAPSECLANKLDAALRRVTGN